MKCIIEYKDQEHKCFCKELKECSECNSGNSRKSEKECEIPVGGWFTCRTCGYAVRA